MAQKRVNIGLDEKIHTKAKILSAVKQVALAKYFEKAIEEAIERDKKLLEKALK